MNTTVQLITAGERLEIKLRGRITAIPFDVVKCGNPLGLVFELMNSDTLSNRIQREPHRVQEFTVQYAALLRELHAVKVPAGSRFLPCIVCRPHQGTGQMAERRGNGNAAQDPQRHFCG